MTRRPTLDEMMLADAGKGIPTDKKIDIADPEELVMALMAFDRRGDLEPLKRWMCCDRPPEARALIDDFFARQPPGRKKIGRPRPPIYTGTENEMAKYCAVMAVKHRATGVSVKRAIEKAAARYGLSEGAVADAYAGRGATYRAKKKWGPKVGAL
jgi:hypothetical protein